MKTDSNKLWPFSRGLALAAIPMILILSIVILVSIRYFVGWPGEEMNRWIVLLVAVMSFLPLLLVLLDFFARNRAVVDVRGFKIDFSKVDFNYTEIKRMPIGIADNMGVTGPIITDTAPMDIIAALDETIRSELVVINIGRGNNWWVTRLLALAAGAVRTGYPEAFVFVGVQENVPNNFLGWARHRDVLESILQDKEQYERRYQKSKIIAQQFAIYHDVDLKPDDLTLASEVMRYINDPKYDGYSEMVAEQILMDQIGHSYGYGDTGSLEDQPDRLTLGRLLDLFGHCLYRQSIDLNDSNANQIQSLIESRASYVGLVRQGVFDSMLKREDSEIMILKLLLDQSTQNYENIDQ